MMPVAVVVVAVVVMATVSADLGIEPYYFHYYYCID